MKNQNFTHTDGIKHFTKNITLECNTPEKYNSNYHIWLLKDGKEQRIRVAVRNETDSSSPSSHFKFSPTGEYDWVAFLFKFKNGIRSCWIIPKDIAIKHTNASIEGKLGNKKVSLSIKKLSMKELTAYKDNWHLKQ